MRVPISWLKEYVDIELPVEELASRLTMAGIMLENIEQFSPREKVLELELTPNRSDCLGIINVAREVAVVTGATLHLPEIKTSELAGEGGETAADYTSVEIAAPELCGRYLARIIKNVRVAPSPLWMQERLQAAGIRPISNVVDVTNYVMLETGQPLHAFDYHRLAEHRIVVRRARPGETMHTLDGEERELDPEMLVIADARRPVALAGIMGGLDSEVTEQTRTVLLESAHFERVNNRQSARKMGMRTESSLRFEKGTDIAGVAWAADRAVQLMVQIGAGQAVEGAVDVYLNHWFPRDIFLRVSRVNQLLGTRLSQQEVAELLKRLGLDVRLQGGEGMLVSVPSYRQDLEREEDLVEEVARLYGYDKIPTTLPVGATTPGIKNRKQRLEDRCRDLMVASGLTEVITFSFVNPGVFDRIRLAAGDPRRRVLMLANPLNEDMRVLRTTLIPNLLETAARNFNRRVVDLGIFELGRVFWPKPSHESATVQVGSASLFLSDSLNQSRELPDERTFLGGLSMGSGFASWDTPAQPLDFFYLKGVLEELLEGLGAEDCRFVQVADQPTFHPGRTACVQVAGQPVGVIGEVHPEVMELYGINRRVTVFEIDLELLFPLLSEGRAYRPLPRFPAVQRDLALVVSDRFPAEEIAGCIRELGRPLLERVELFDLYRGGNIPAGHRSLAFSLSFRASDRTLTDDEVNQVHQEIVAGLGRAFDARLR